jgi:hypothetical protein
MGLLVLFALFTFIFGLSSSGVSIGGHLGGGLGGALAALGFLTFRRTPALATASMAAIGVAAIAVAILSV